MKQVSNLSKRSLVGLANGLIKVVSQRVDEYDEWLKELKNEDPDREFTPEEREKEAAFEEAFNLYKRMLDISGYYCNK